MNRVDPRTGRIIQGQPGGRIQSTTYFPVKKKSLLQQIDMELLMKIAEKIGKTIAAELKELPVQQVSANTPTTQTRRSTRSNRPEFATAITIDESLIDVGLGDTGELQKGEGSASLKKGKAKQDKQLSASRNRLKALKRGK